MMTALSAPSSYSITNGRVRYQRLFPHHTTLRPPFINCLYCCKLLLLVLESPKEKETTSKNNPPFPRLTLSQYTKIYQRILFYQDSSKILRMRERLVPGPYLSPSAHRARKRAWVRERLAERPARNSTTICRCKGYRHSIVSIPTKSGRLATMEGQKWLSLVMHNTSHNQLEIREGLI